MDVGFLKVIGFFGGAQILAVIDNLVKSRIVEKSEVTLLTPLNPYYYVKYPLALFSVVLGFLQFVLLLRGFEEGARITNNQSIASISYAAFLLVFSVFVGINYVAFGIVRKELITFKEWFLILGIIVLQVCSAIFAWLLGLSFSKK